MILQSRLLRDNLSVVICTHHSSDIECHNDYQVDQNPKGHVIIQSRMQCNDVLVIDYRSYCFYAIYIKQHLYAAYCARDFLGGAYIIL
ncbi:hypothetical protein YYY_03255 [Anaplasma phagocytophilum str. Dog2]|nr:hypothetical protein WSQ_03260 [Anaplasma phagocytophilum str. JM]AGR81935.1 hypothetical protein YYY_03255 [Anaplasma phagocytophilum str. Dog2]PLC10085.1 hypothetical protein C0V68_03075 [Anaplasma phagocytophilum]